MFSIRRKVASAAIGGLAIVLTAGAASAATGVTGPHATRSIKCNGVEATAPAPIMKAVNRTTAVDRQIVAFQPVVFRWNSTSAQWVEYSTYGPAHYGTATDSASPTTWYDLGTGAYSGDGHFTMMLTDRGYFRVAYRMWWATGSSWTGSDYVWASGYYTQSAIGAVTPANWCYR